MAGGGWLGDLAWLTRAAAAAAQTGPLRLEGPPPAGPGWRTSPLPRLPATRAELFGVAPAAPLVDACPPPAPQGQWERALPPPPRRRRLLPPVAGPKLAGSTWRRAQRSAAHRIGGVQRGEAPPPSRGPRPACRH